MKNTGTNNKQSLFEALPLFVCFRRKGPTRTGSDPATKIDIFHFILVCVLDV
jgi:hypothetical protein